ncbi:MAG: hydrogenase iron-sulfur subunit [Nitrospinota bacterium]|nr:hydrogenase iron-sulfur subunit [Nitrospinota bacterium]
MADIKKSGAYICSGCGIGDSVNVEALATVATKEGKAALTRTHPMLCGAEGVALVKEDVASGAVTAVSIAACSPRVCYDIFNFGENIVLDRIDIREKVAWSQEPRHMETQALAEDYIRMGMVKIKAMEIPIPFIPEEPSKTIMVLGGGIAGMTAAINAAKAGYKVELVEKEAALGGFANTLGMRLPDRAPYDAPMENDIASLIEEVIGDSYINVHLGATINKISGGPGIFDVSLVNGANKSFRAGAIVLATGFKSYDVKKLTRLGSDLPGVVGSVEFERMLKEGKAPPRRIVFILCAGSRDDEHLPYCSSVCCASSLKQAWLARQANPEASVTVIYRDIRTTGNMELFYKQVQQDPGIFMTKGESPVVAQEGGELSVTADNTLLGGKVKFMADMVVLATGMVPSTLDPSVKVDKPEDQMQDFDRDQVGKASILKLDYRQGPEVPDLKLGFPDSHFICFPYETRRTGIYAAGTVRHPMDASVAKNDAVGAAMKAIQCVEMVPRGETVHPRAGDLSHPEFAMERCTQCKRCTVECPFGAINEDEKTNPIPVKSRCRRCATCMGACPVQIINFKNYSISMVGAMIKAIDMPEEDEERPRVLAFICENDAMPALEMAGINRLRINPVVRFIPLRCMGSLNLQWIADALSSGWDGIMLLGCKHGDDYQCHNIKGSELATTRASKVQETLDRLMLESERILVDAVQISDWQKLPKMIDDFVEQVSGMEPNPYKGF